MYDFKQKNNFQCFFVKFVDSLAASNDWADVINIGKSYEGRDMNVIAITKVLYHYWFWMEQKGMTFDHDFYVVVGKQCRTENAYAGHQHNIFI